MFVGFENMGSEAKSETSRPSATLKVFMLASGETWAMTQSEISIEAEAAATAFSNDEIFGTMRKDRRGLLAWCIGIYLTPRKVKLQWPLVYTRSLGKCSSAKPVVQMKKPTAAPWALRYLIELC